MILPKSWILLLNQQCRLHQYLSRASHGSLNQMLAPFVYLLIEVLVGIWAPVPAPSAPASAHGEAETETTAALQLLLLRNVVRIEFYFPFFNNIEYHSDPLLVSSVIVTWILLLHQLGYSEHICFETAKLKSRGLRKTKLRTDAFAYLVSLSDRWLGSLPDSPRLILK